MPVSAGLSDGPAGQTTAGRRGELGIEIDGHIVQPTAAQDHNRRGDYDYCEIAPPNLSGS
jgi:hypothetical protein